MGWPELSSPLSAWQWAAFLAVPPAIIALYFLKLRRQPLQVPSTYLWQRTLEDMHVNSLWQRLRQNLLLLLQLLMVAFLMLACLRPHWLGTRSIQERAILLIDTSASMSATDVEGSRLDVAKQQASAILAQMPQAGFLGPSDQTAVMIISFSDRARIEQPFTTNRRLLEKKLMAIKPTQRTSDISEALTAAAGLANPGRSGDVGAGDMPAAEPLPADVYIFSDGAFQTIPDFSWGNLRPHYVSIGDATATNCGITAFNANAIPGRLDKLQALVQAKNYTDTDVEVEFSLFLDDKLLDAAATTLPAQGMAGVDFTFDRPNSAQLRIELSPDDAFGIDNVAYAAINPPERVNVLLVTDGNDALEVALATEDVEQLANIEIVDPDRLSEDAELLDRIDTGSWQLVIFDNCQPPRDPEANTLYFGSLPPNDAWQVAGQHNLPQIIDIDVAHPLMQYLDFNNVTLATGSTLVPPPGNRILMDSDMGPLFAIAPRGGFEDAVFGFALVASDDEGQRFANTDWPLRLSFPLFVHNAILYLGNANLAEQRVGTKPGNAVTLRSEMNDALRVVTPSGDTVQVTPGDMGHIFQNTDAVGIYTYGASENETGSMFAVNLFDETESEISPRPELETAYTSVEAAASVETTRREFWRPLVAFALVVLVFEWYIYNRRLYL